MYAVIEPIDTSKVTVFCNEGDVCLKCLNISNCPLIGAVQTEIVILRYERIMIKECKMMKYKTNRKAKKVDQIMEG